MCHGSEGLGDGRVSEFLVAYNYFAAPDLTLDGTVSKTDGDLYGILTNGINVMPTFKNLLSPGDRWLLVDYMRQLQGR
jgi:mono/diheme cytochrome c family protein